MSKRLLSSTDFGCLIFLLSYCIVESIYTAKQDNIWNLRMQIYTFLIKIEDKRLFFLLFSVFLQLFDIYRARFCNNLVNQLKQQTYFF